jgi:tetratricopeptide (TPR) repeat protein
MPSKASFVYSTLGRAYRSQGDYAKAIEHHTQDLAIAKEVGNRAGEGTAYGNLGTCHMHLNEYVKPSPTAKHIMLWQPRCSLHTCSLTQRSTWVSPSSFASAQLARALPSHPIPPN